MDEEDKQESQEQENEVMNEPEKISINKNQIYAVVGAIFIISFFVFAANAMLNTNQINYPVTGQAAAPTELVGGKQVIKISMQGGTYLPNPIRLKKGVPAVLEVDTSKVRGCYRAIQIPAFGVRKITNDGDNKIEFTPDKAGTFGISCYMGMGRGQIVVEDETGNVPSTNTVAQDIPKGSSCGAGGCGCGGG